MNNTRKYQKIVSCIFLTASALLLAGCPSVASVIPSFLPSLVPSVNYNTLSVTNPNQIQCYPGGWFSSEYCAIPINRFVAISSHYASPYESNQLINFANQYQSFVFDRLDESQVLESLNIAFMKQYPTADKFAKLPTAVQSLYIKMKEEYIGSHQYQKQMETYIYLYALSTIDYANQICSESVNSISTPDSQQRALYKVFSMMFTNDVLHHVALNVTGKYKNEVELYNKVYDAILDLNPYQLANMAQMTYSNIYNNKPKMIESDFYTTGTSFGEIGSFSCNANGTMWQRFGYPYFGSNVAGLPYYVNFINKDNFSKYDDDEIPVQ